ncbi:MAG TPA: 2OG-Fe(II) oxygenase [Gemmataceae bacterium]|nr:2OG-Fe(II) oxygenase [Gemmataceae bacterium]
MEKEELDGERIFLLHNFLSPEECEQFIARTEEAGYSDAPITTAVGFVMRKDIRDNDRVMIDHEELARQLFERARPMLPATWFGWELAGFNERFRFYRYGPGQRFAAHTDGYYERPNGERSHLTFMVYLNESFEGGATLFERWRDSLDVVPRTGMALVFYHKLVHEGTEVLKGRKYVLRTDVMYRRAASNK